MKIAIRMDDITPDMDWGKFKRFKDLLDAHHITPLIGVVPRNKDEKLSINPAREDFWDYIKNLRDRGWVVAMHGYKHRYTTKDPGLFPIGGKSEFAGLPFDKQDEMRFCPFLHCAAGGAIQGVQRRAAVKRALFDPAVSGHPDLR